MTEQSPEEKLGTLTDRQREVLALYCQGNDYPEIADLLVLSHATIKSHMDDIYQRLDLKQYGKAKRNKLLFEIYCPLLKDITQEPVPVVTSKPANGDKRNNGKNGEEDEIPEIKTIEPYRSQPLSPQPDSSQRGTPRILGCAIIVIALIAGLIAVGLILTNQVDLGGGAQTDDPQPASSTEELVQVSTDEPATTETVELVATQNQPEPTAVIPSSTPVVIVTVVQYTPTPVPEPTSTPDIDTPSGSVVQAGEWWMQDDVWLRVKSAQLTEQGGIWIILEMWNQTSNPLSWQWNAGGNLSLTDNTGHIYIPTNQSSNLIGQSILDPGELSEVTLRSFGYSAVYQDPSFFNPNVTELILTVIGFPNIPEAKFRIPV